MTDTRHVVAEFQRAWNHFSRERGLHYHALGVDGSKGKHTRVVIQKARFFVGVGPTNWRKNSTDISPNLLRALHNPFGRLPGETRRENKARRRLGSKRRKERIMRWSASHRPHPSTKGLVYFDGKLCAAWIAKWLVRARAAGVHFTMTSGYRNPVYSESLCFRRCGRPSCPGTCAGRASRHSGVFYPNGAADNVPPWELRAWLAHHGAPLTNHLPYDSVHVSATGY